MKFYWKCQKCGYEWQVSPAHRNRGHGCPACTNQAVKKGYNDLLSQRPDVANEWDYEKNILGPDEVTYQSVKSYYWICSKCGHNWKTKVSVRTSLGCGCPICSRDKISDKQRYCEENESLAIMEPELIKEWDYEKNTLDPKHIKRHCNEKAFWKCLKGHSWESVINSRLNGKNKCPYCSGRLAIVGENDLATTHPQLIEEWDYNKNKLTPQQVKSGTSKKAWWICKKCGYEWETLINIRTRGCGCPRCKGRLK